VFEVFGVGAETELTYRVLLRRPDLTEPVEPSHLSVPAALAGPIFNELVQAGLLVPDATGWVIVPPELAVETLSARAEEQLEQRRNAIHQAKAGITAAVADLVDSHRGPAAAVTEVIRGSDAVRARLHQLTQDATEHVWSINPGPALPPRAVEASRAMDRTLHAHQVTQRAVFADAAVSDPGFVAYLREVVDRGDQVRRHPAPPVRLLLFDDTVACVPVNEHDPGRGALIVHEPGLLKPLVALFEQTWATASPPDLAPAGAIDSQWPRVRQVLTMLIQGHSDPVIARQLGISPRTVGRLVAEAGRRVQATSRIEICVLALRAGWIAAGDVTPDQSDADSSARSDRLRP
jgi:DNA-binding CsgD family transcriptional regulator